MERNRRAGRAHMYVERLCVIIVAKVDATSGPTTPYSSVEHGNFTYGGYTGVYNLLDYSAVSFPCGINVDANLDVSYRGHQALSEIDTQVRNDCELSKRSCAFP